tara:strand:- start:120 stop:1133 length:1014 start_codon:yes stop_codon:yes gene_type:complete
MLKQFTAKGLPKQRFYNMNFENPLSDSFLVGRESKGSENSLRQFFGFESNENNSIQILENKVFSEGSNKNKKGTLQDLIDKNLINNKKGKILEFTLKERICRSVFLPKLEPVNRYEKKTNLSIRSKEPMMEEIRPSEKIVEEKPKTPDEKLKKAVDDASKCCLDLIKTNSEYITMKSTAKQMLNEVDDATIFFDEELMSRLTQTAQLIRQIQKNPAPAQINSLKKNLVIKNLKKQKRQLAQDEEDFLIDLDQYEGRENFLNSNQQYQFTQGSAQRIEGEEEGFGSFQSSQSLEQIKQRDLLYGDNEIIDIGEAEKDQVGSKSDQRAQSNIVNGRDDH